MFNENLVVVDAHDQQQILKIFDGVFNKILGVFFEKVFDFPKSKQENLQESFALDIVFKEIDLLVQKRRDLIGSVSVELLHLKTRIEHRIVVVDDFLQKRRKNVLQMFVKYGQQSPDFIHQKIELLNSYSHLGEQLLVFDRPIDQEHQRAGVAPQVLQVLQMGQDLLFYVEGVLFLEKVENRIGLGEEGAELAVDGEEVRHAEVDVLDDLADIFRVLQFFFESLFDFCLQELLQFILVLVFEEDVDKLLHLLLVFEDLQIVPERLHQLPQELALKYLDLVHLLG